MSKKQKNKKKDIHFYQLRFYGCRLLLLWSFVESLSEIMHGTIIVSSLFEGIKTSGYPFFRNLHEESWTEGFSGCFLFLELSG